MAILTTKTRKVLPAKTFGLPAERKYPMPDKAHAGDAKARAAQQVGKTITKAQQAEIDSKANGLIGTAQRK